MSLYYPEGWRIDTPQNRNAMLSYSHFSLTPAVTTDLEGAPSFATAHTTDGGPWLYERHHPPGKEHRHWNGEGMLHCHYFPCK